MSFFAMFSTGLCLSSVRVLVDPYHRKLILIYVAEWFGHIIKRPDEGLVTKPLNTFLAESLNLELIYIILKGINEF
jgi:hypothetical protein